MTFSPHVSLANDIYEMWKEIGSPSLSSLLKDKITEEKAKIDSKRKAASTPVNITADDMEAALRAEQEEEAKHQEQLALEKDYLERKDFLLNQAREIFIKNGKRGAMNAARLVTAWRDGQREITKVLMEEAGACQK